MISRDRGRVLAGLAAAGWQGWPASVIAWMGGQLFTKGYFNE